MELQQKQAIVSVMGSIGLIVLFAGIFLKNVSFTLALFVAISLWILSGVVATFLGISKNVRIQHYSGWRYGIVSLVGSLGVIILLSGIFLNVPFTDALFIAIVLWISSGAIAAFLGVNKKAEYYSQPPLQYQPYSSQPVQPVSNQYSSQLSQSPVTQTSIGQDVISEGPAKKFCQKCGTSVELDATFCSNCGASL